MTDSHDDHQDDHGHDHSHSPAAKDHDDQLTYFRAMEIALREIFRSRKVYLRRTMFGARSKRWTARTPENGARLVARAWCDPGYKERLLGDGSAAAREMGYEVGVLRLMVIENTPTVHNLVVCTLCSCYPRMLMGLPPAWYKSAAYRSRAVREPRAVLREFGPHSRPGGSARARQHRRHALYDFAASPGRNGRLERGATSSADYPR